MSKVDILGCSFLRWGQQETARNIASSIQQGKKFYLCTVNVAILMMMRDISKLEDFIQKADMIVADGQPIVWTSKKLNKPIPERVTGVDLVHDLADMAVANNWGIYLIGATDEILEKTGTALKEQHSGLNIAAPVMAILTNSKHLNELS